MAFDHNGAKPKDYPGIATQLSQIAFTKVVIFRGVRVGVPSGTSSGFMEAINAADAAGRVKDEFDRAARMNGLMGKHLIDAVPRETVTGMGSKFSA